MANPELNGQIIFQNTFEPPMESGDYTVKINQQVTGTGSQPFDETFQNVLSFGVTGVRFSIPPNYIHTQFPPADTQGEFSNVLPHVVFTAKTLPWQRDLGDLKLTQPWIALLVFDESDSPPPIQTLTLNDLQHPPSNIASYPNLILEHNESSADPVQVIDIPITLFNNIIPSLADMPWLAHARTITSDTTRKAVSLNGTVPGTEFSVIIANRLPAAGKKTTCFLVSVENMGTYLYGQEGPPAGTTAVRTAVLSSWSFDSLNLPETFKEYLLNLNITPSTLQVPYIDIPGVEKNTDVVQALEMGYTAISHLTRKGAQTVSWFRGPLLPYANSQNVSVPVASSDALLQYNPQTGMMDTSLTAAWQLGQLLALSDKDFATTLYAWKRKLKQDAVTEFEQNFLNDTANIDPAEKILPPNKLPHINILNNLIKPILTEMFSKKSST